MISENQGRKIENTIFLSALPTDDNFQMLSIFGTLSMKKLMQANIFNAFDFLALCLERCKRILTTGITIPCSQKSLVTNLFTEPIHSDIYKLQNQRCRN